MPSGNAPEWAPCSASAIVLPDFRRFAWGSSLRQDSDRSHRFAGRDLADCVGRVRRRADSADRYKVALVTDRVVRLDHRVERQRLITGRADFDVMRAGRQIQVVRMPVEIIDDPRVRPVDLHLGCLWLNFQSKTAADLTGLNRVL